MSRDGGAGATAGPLGIVAGGGTLPVEIARTALGQGRPVHIVALRNQADAAIEQFPHTWVDWGQIGAIRGAFRIHGCRDLVLAGTVRRPNLWSLRPDLGPGSPYRCCFAS